MEGLPFFPEKFGYIFSRKIDISEKGESWIASE